MCFNPLSLDLDKKIDSNSPKYTPVFFFIELMINANKIIFFFYILLKKPTCIAYEECDNTKGVISQLYCKD